MKLQAIKKACKDAGVFYIFNCGGQQQFLSNGVAAWPVEGLWMTKDMIPALFDLNAKQQEKLVINELDMKDERFRLEPVEGERLLKDMGLVWSCGTLYRALRGDEGLLFIDAALTKPGENKDGDFYYTKRDKENGTPLIACYGDMLVSALVMPMKAQGIMEDLERIAGEPLNVFWNNEEQE